MRAWGYGDYDVISEAWEIDMWHTDNDYVRVWFPHASDVSKKCGTALKINKKRFKPIISCVQCGGRVLLKEYRT